jgi:hypothetical protein
MRILITNITTTSNTNLNPTMPTFPNDPNQTSAVQYGWQLFVAMNWPASSSQRGVPDPSLTIGNTSIPTVWETFKTPDEVFLPDGSKPVDWSTYAMNLPPECNQLSVKKTNHRQHLLSQLSKVRGGGSSNAEVKLTDQVAGGSLTDQNQNLVRYSITFNKPIFDFVYDGGYYNVEGQASLKSVNFNSGSIETKAAWRIMTPKDQGSIRYLRRMAYVYTPASVSGPASCAFQEVGLVGLHITQKVTFSIKGVSYTRWVWTTFEQVDNVPPFGTPYTPGKDPSRTLPYSFFNPCCYDSTCNVGAVTACTYNQSTFNGRPTTTPTEVIRTINIGPEAAASNPGMQAQLANATANSPFQFYQLINVQWSQKPDQPPFGNPTPPTMANTTMETYIPQSSCVGCHYTAAIAYSSKVSSDYSFMLAEAQSSTKKNTANKKKK